MHNIVIQISINNSERSAKQGYRYSRDSWKKWADINNVGFYTFKENISTDIEPQWNKIFILDILKESGVVFDKVLYVDSDTIVHPNMPNIFDLVGRDFGVVRNFGSMDWVCRSVENYSKLLFDNYFLNPFKYFNSGVMVFNKDHQEFFTQCQKFLIKNIDKIKEIQKLGVGKDQPVLNFLTEIYGVKKKYLPYEFNMQDMNRFEVLGSDMLHTNFGWIYHFNAGVQPTPAHWMKETLNFLKEI